MVASSRSSWSPPPPLSQPWLPTCSSTAAGGSPRRSSGACWATQVPDRIRRGMAPNSSPGPTGADMAGIGIYLAAAVLLPIVGGVALDKALNTAPVFVLVGLFVGLVAGAAGIWLKVRELSR